MDVETKFKLQFDVKQLVRFVIATSECGKTETEIVEAIERDHKDFIRFS